MNPIKKFLRWFGHLHSLSKTAIQVGVLTMFCLYIIALVAWGIAPRVNYSNAMNVHRGCLEAAPAALAAGVCAGLIGDLMLRKGKNDAGDDPED